MLCLLWGGGGVKYRRGGSGLKGMVGWVGLTWGVGVGGQEERKDLMYLAVSGEPELWLGLVGRFAYVGACSGTRWLEDKGRVGVLRFWGVV